MPILKNFILPASARLLALPEAPKAKLFIAFIASDDPITGQPWCPDVRAAWPHIQGAFLAEEAPTVAIVAVGQREEWRDPKNVYRSSWNVHNVPVLARYQRVDGRVVETGRLTEGEILDSAKMDPITAAGLALAIPPLAFQVFAGCIQGFTTLSSAQNLGKDASFLLTMLTVEEYRCLQWADAVGLTTTNCIAPQVNQRLAEELLVQLRDRLDSSKLRQRYSLDLLVDSREEPQKVPVEEPLPMLAVSSQRRGEILARAQLIQSQASLPRRLWWAAVDKAKFQDLVHDLRQIVDALWNLLEPLRLRELAQTVGHTLTAVVDMSRDITALKALQASCTRATVFPGDAILATAVGLKVERAQMEKKAGEDPVHPLHRSLLQRSPARGVYPGEYEGKTVLCESKPVHPRLKAKLRRRSENLARLLSGPRAGSFMTLACLGVVEDVDEFVFVYDYPPGADITAHPRSLHDLLRDSKMRAPSVTARVRLALAICQTLLTVHTSGWLHKNIRSENILFFAPDATLQPYLAGFTFARADSPLEISDQASEDPLSDVYRHPQALGDPSCSYAMYMDLYSLGAVLLEIAEWRPLKHIVRKHIDVADRECDVSLAALAATQDWLVREVVDRGLLEFRMGDVVGRPFGFAEFCP
ncbi:hypothetical protein ASPZODRAFT_17394 [Penicilliopsis zonata CBS 506.65]|uniref:Protein kinase domain-containing protein n=1 Tax=Penicilliopsis zonata CBS 506.65 TaxID=1073090 RepID=A0A1L9SG09_9EURO|nr:hypothetical protein ASPZODRAFT_17394 [Penicilliopsis zonata CBS 506.65]OJJ45964.1 hypothetical protein ASPZODRAFT_17394 [Penicilliopsis zonata CBS 506.65]